MADKGTPQRPPKWDVRAYVADSASHPEVVQDNYRRINLAATLTWGITHTQLYRTWKLERVLDYLLNGMTITIPGPEKLKEIELYPTIDNAFEYGYFGEGARREDVADAVRALAEMPITGTDVRVAQLISLGHLYWGDCSQKSFPAAEMSRQFEILRAAGLQLECYDRFKQGPTQSLGPDPVREQEINRALAVYGDCTIAEVYCSSLTDVRLLHHFPYLSSEGVG